MDHIQDQMEDMGMIEDMVDSDTGSQFHINRTKPSFMSLPVEVRAIILRYVFPDLIHDRINELNWPYPEPRLAILLVNRDLHHCARFILQHQVPFRVTISDCFIHMLNQRWERYPMSTSYISPFSSQQDPSFRKVARSIRNWDIVLEMQIPHPIFAPWPPEFRVGGKKEELRLCGLKDSVAKFVAFIQRDEEGGYENFAYNRLSIGVDESIAPAWTVGAALRGLEQVLEPFRKLSHVVDMDLSEKIVEKMVIGGVVPEEEVELFQAFRIGFQQDLQRTS